jgi:fructoselysine 3-epimerase
MWGSSIIFEDYPLERAMEIMASLGYTRVDMSKPHLRRCVTPQLREYFVSYAARLGLTMGGLNVVGEDYFKPFGTKQERRETLEGLQRDVDFALSLGMKDVLIWEGVRPQGYSDSQCREELLPGLIDLFREAIAYSAPKGARFLVEPHPFTVGMSDDFLIALVDSLPENTIGITFDFCHYGVGRPHDYIDAVPKLGRRIRNIHFSDSDLLSSEVHFAPGDGRVDIDGLLRAFREIGYSGPVTLDLYNNPTPIEATRRSSKRLGRACEFLGLPAA